MVVFVREMVGGNTGSEGPSARCGDKGVLLGLRQYTRSNRQIVEEVTAMKQNGR